MQKLRLIQAGMGGMGRTWWKSVVRGSPDFDLVAIVDVVDEPLNQAGDELGISSDRRFKSLESALDQVEADAVLTVTPPTVHVEHAKLTFSHGLHLLTEKPIAHDLASAKNMVELARQTGRQLLVAQNYRYSAPMQAMKKLFDEKPLGEFGHGHIDFYIPADFPGTFRETMEFPLLVDMAIHHLDLIRFITGRNIARVTAQTFKPSWSWFEHHPGLKMLMELDGEIPFSYSGDWTARGRPTTWNGSWRLQFAEGSIHVEDDQITLARCDKWSKNISLQSIEIAQPDLTGQAALLSRFAQAIREGKPAETSGEDNLWSFAAVMAGVESAKERREIDVLHLLRS
jgi:predicted dehydrogenase